MFAKVMNELNELRKKRVRTSAMHGCVTALAGTAGGE
jgi:hypothetical protein